MVSQEIIDLSTIDLNNVVVDKEEILKLNAQRYEFEQLDKVVYFDEEEHVIAGMKHQKEDEFWVKGHIPGRPLMPGVLMIEMAAQLGSIMFHKIFDTNGTKFFGFGGVNNIKFRGAVVPGQDFYMIAKATKMRSRITIFHAQGYVDGNMVFEGDITGVVL